MIERAPSIATRSLVCTLGFAVLMLCGVASAEASGRRILLLQSADRGNLGLDTFTANLRIALDVRLGEPVSFVQFVVTPSGYTSTPEAAVVQYLQSAAAGQRRPDLVVTVGGLAAVFARKHRAELFPDAPLLLAATDRRFIESTPLADDETAVAVDNNGSGLVDDILRVLPQTSTILVVIGSGELGQFWRNRLGQEFSRFGTRVTFEWFVGRTFKEILRRVSALPPGYAILYITFGQDAEGGAYADEAALAQLHAAATAPIFATQSAALGHGVVGGTLISIDQLTETAADAASRILNGESPAAVRPPAQRPGPPIFDWRELQRWKISESLLPDGSRVFFREPTLWQRYRSYVLAAIGLLLVESLLIGALMYERRVRRLAEAESRRTLAIAADLDRRLAVTSLSGALAHDLSQPLAAIRFNAEAARMLLATHRASADDLIPILQDIAGGEHHASAIVDRHRKMLQQREFDRRPLDVCAVARDSLAFVAHAAQMRGVRLDDRLSNERRVVLGDPVMLQQVVVNLLVNAMDAMADTPASLRRVAVLDDSDAGTVVLSIRDNGAGLPPAIRDRLFEPFVTSKPDGVGIGLTIVDAIVRAHGGTVDGINNPQGGATFFVRLPLTPS